MAETTDSLWLPVLPSMKEFGPALVKGAASEGDKAGKETGKRFGKALAVGVAAVGAGALAAGTALYKVGEVFDDVTDTIRVGTGATGKDLEGLVEVAKNVGTKVPASFEDIGSVVADVNTRMGLSGETLDKVASQYLEAGRILGEEVDIMKTGAAFNAFKIEGEDVSGALDHLFRVSQATGIGMNELAGTVQNAAPAAQALGFSFEETAGMVGTLDKAGLNSSKMMAGLSRGLVELSKDGEKPADAFKRVVGEMEGFMKSGNDAAAMEIASKVFGTKNAPQFLQAIKDGKLELGSLSDVAGMTDDTILGAGEATMDFAEQWQMFKNKILVWLEPLGSKVFGALGDAMDVVNQSVTAFGAAWAYNDGEITSSGIPGFMERVGYLARQLFDYFNTTAIPALKNFGRWMMDNKTTIGIVAGVLGTLMIPMLIKWGIQATVAKYKVIAAFVASKVEAIKSAAVFVAQSYRMVGGWIAMGLAAVKSGAETAAIWLMYRVESLKAAAAMVAAKVRVVASWVAMSAAAVASGIKTAAVWTAQIVKSAVVGAAQFLAQVGRIVGGWVLMGAQALLQGARIAAGWVLAMGPVGWVITIIGALVAAVVVAYNKMGWFKDGVNKAWAGIKAGIGAVWNWMKATFNLIKTWVTVTLPSGFNFFRDKASAAWNSVKSGIGIGWAAIRSVFTTMRDWLRNILSGAFTFLRDKVNTVWNGIKTVIKTVWTNGIKPVFDVMGKVLRGDFVGAFQHARDSIKRIWDGLKDIAKKPISFVINTVLNEGLIGAFNKVAGWIPGVKKLDKVSIPGFARGGWTGPGAKYDEAGIVHADEFVIRKESQRSLAKRAPGFLDSLNRYGAAALGYASGGLVRPVKGGRVTSGFGSSRGRYPHAGIDLAVPVGTPVFASMAGRVSRAGWNAITGRSGIGAFLDHEGGRNTYYGHLSKLLVKVGDMVRKGQQIALSGNTGKSTGPHLHWETWTGGKPVNPAAYLGGAMLPEGGVGGDPGGGFNPLSFITDAMGKIGGWFKNKFPGGGVLADIAQGTGTKLFTDVVEWVRSKIDFLGDVAKDTWSNVKGFFTGGKSKHKEAVRGVAERYGWGSGDQWNALQSIVSKESGWNPNAANPRSSARGLFQKMTSLHGPVEGSAAGQAEWGLRYIKQRYGNPMNAWSHWQRHNSYAGGGHVQPSLYDQGGVLPPGLTSILNNTRKPEAILNPAQWQSVMKSIEVSRRVADGVGTTVYNIQTPQHATVDDLTAALRFEKRRVSRGGVG